MFAQNSRPIEPIFFKFEHVIPGYFRTDIGYVACLKNALLTWNEEAPGMCCAGGKINLLNLERMLSFPKCYEEIKLISKYLISLKDINSNKHESVTLISRANPRRGVLVIEYKRFSKLSLYA